LPSACSCYQLAPQRTFTSYPVPMPGTPRTSPAGGPKWEAVLDCRCARRPHLRAGRDGRMAPRGAEQKNGNEWNETGGQNDVRPDTLIPSPHVSTKPGQVQYPQSSDCFYKTSHSAAPKQVTPDDKFLQRTGKLLGKINPGTRWALVKGDASESETTARQFCALTALANHPCN
jgi:hypothetical protein